MTKAVTLSTGACVSVSVIIHYIHLEMWYNCTTITVKTAIEQNYKLQIRVQNPKMIKFTVPIFYLYKILKHSPPPVSLSIIRGGGDQNPPKLINLHLLYVYCLRIF